MELFVVFLVIVAIFAVTLIVMGYVDAKQLRRKAN